MTDKRMLLLLCLVLLIPRWVLGQAQCKVPKDLGGKFKVVWSESAVVEGRRIFFVRIGLKGTQFSEGNLRNVARRIRETYCNESNINAVLVDTSDRRKFDDLTPPPIFPPSTRALYSLERTHGEEKLEFYRDEKYGATIKLN